MTQSLLVPPRLRAVGGSARGRAHRRAFRNNQDAWATRVGPGFALGVVADGCGSGSASEVGARLATARIASRGPALLAQHGPTRAFADAVLDDLGAALALWVDSIATEDERADTVAAAFLFTLLVAAATPRETLVFGVGDGIVLANGEVRTLDAGADNAPPYLGYRLVPGSVPPALLTRTAPTIHLQRRGPGLIAIGTDGLAPLVSASGGVGPELGGLLDDPRLLSSNVALGRRLAALSLKDPRLQDDATLVLVDAGGAS